MSKEPFSPTPAAGTVDKTGERWTFVLARELRHPPAKVWAALTDPAQLREWAPFDADVSLAKTGTKVKLTTVGAPKPMVVETTIKRAEPPKSLEYNWGGGEVRWELSPMGSGTRLTLWASIPRNYVAMGAAGWHLCLDIMDHMLNGEHIGRIVGPDALKFEGWQRLNGEYSKLFGVEVVTPSW